MSEPLITAAFTAFNAQSTILAALRSAVAQDWPNLEILVVDDSSSDNTAELVDAFIAERSNLTPPIRLIRQQLNGGESVARNRLAEEANGEFIAFFDDDDISAPDRIRKQFERIRFAEKAHATDRVLCHTARTQIYPEGFERYEPTMGTEDTAIPDGSAAVQRILIGRLSKGVIGSCAACSLMLRKQLYQSLNGFDPALRRACDTDFDIRAGLKGCFFAGLAEPLVTQTMTRGTEKTLTADVTAYTALFDKHQAYLQQQGWLSFCRAWQDVRYAWLGRQHGQFCARAIALFLRFPFKFMQKIVWSLPAQPTQRSYRRWQNAK